MRYFTHYWSNRTFRDQAASSAAGEPLDYLGGNQFRRRGVCIGDRVYAITNVRGQLYLIGALTVGEILLSDYEARRRLGYDPWPASEHLIAEPGSESGMRFDRRVPPAEVRQLAFVTKHGLARLVLRADGRIDQQTLRGVRRLAPDSAAVLERHLSGG